MKLTREKTAVVVGSGIAGIATAIRLQNKGFQVTVFEANAYPGGKLTTIEKDGYRWDAGPSLFTMPSLVTELFDLCGENFRDHFNYHQEKEVCRYFWEDGSRFNVDADKEVFTQEASDYFNEPKENIQSYLELAGEKYERTKSVFLESSLHKLSTYTNKKALESLLSFYKFQTSITLNKANQKAFRSEKLHQFFNRYATYNGSDPYKTPGIMSMIPHLEMDLGTFFPKGGMKSISGSLYELAKRIGVDFHFNSKVEEILVKNSKAVGVKVDGKEMLYDTVVSNMDVFSTYGKLLPNQSSPKKVLNQERSSSALIFYWGIKKEFKELGLHNIFFSDKYQEEFKSIFESKELQDDPTIYVHISSKSEKSDAPKASENWFVMINAATNVGQDWETFREQAKRKILDKLSRLLGEEISPLIEVEEYLDPIRIEERTSSHQGSLYGTASNSQFAAFLRHPNFSRKIKSLHFCGGSVHPGGGIPLCLLSAKIVADDF